MEYKKISKAFKAMGDVTRLEVLDMLSNGSLCACKILEKFQITQPTLSYHMKILCDANLVNCVKEGLWMHYSINTDEVRYIRAFIEGIISKEM